MTLILTDENAILGSDGAAQAKKAHLIASQNDQFRKQLFGEKVLVSGQAVHTSGVNGMGQVFIEKCKLAVSDYDDFSEENDPYQERNFGAFTVEAEKLFWKIDYYDTDYRFGSNDPADLEQTRRVLTIMLANEY